MVSVTEHIRNITARRKARGLTLIELVVVIAVLAILAGFIVPRLGFVRNLAAESGNATTIADSATQAVFYNTAVGHYPQGEDSLLVSGGTTLYPGLNPTLAGALAGTSLTTGSNDLKSLISQLDPLAVSFYIADGAAANSGTPNADFATLRTVNTAAAQPFASVTTANAAGIAIYKAAYGAGQLGTGNLPLDGTYLVALGYGSNSQINGKTGLEAPVLFDKEPGEYTRPILLLKVFGDASLPAVNHVPVGSSATTSISVGFDGSTSGAQLTKYAVDQNR